MNRPLILITNDDGITAPGIRKLIEIAKSIGDVVVVAPNSPQSGMGHAITVNNTLFLEKITIDTEISEEYVCSGTPVDCVKIAMNQVVNKTPDLCISGINHGINSATSVLYSGTMSAAVEAAMSGIPAIGFSLDDTSWNADFTPIEQLVKQIIKNSLENNFPKGIALNVNFPKNKNIKGIKICRQAEAMWVENFDERINPHGKKYYWLTGTFHNHDTGTDTDFWALENGYASIVPVKYDLTAYHTIESLKKWNI